MGYDVIYTIELLGIAQNYQIQWHTCHNKVVQIQYFLVSQNSGQIRLDWSGTGIFFGGPVFCLFGPVLQTESALGSPVRNTRSGPNLDNMRDTIETRFKGTLLNLYHIIFLH